MGITEEVIRIIGRPKSETLEYKQVLPHQKQSLK